MAAQPMTPLKRILQEEGRRQSWLANRIGMHESQLSRVVNGLHADDATWAAIAAALGRRIDEVRHPVPSSSALSEAA